MEIRKISKLVMEIRKISKLRNYTLHNLTVFFKRKRARRTISITCDQEKYH